MISLILIVVFSFSGFLLVIFRNSMCKEVCVCVCQFVYMCVFVCVYVIVNSC